MAAAKDRLEKGGRRVVDPTKTVEKTGTDKPSYANVVKPGAKTPTKTKSEGAIKKVTDTGTGAREDRSKGFPGYNKSKGDPVSAGKKHKAKKKADLAKSVRSFEKQYNDIAQREKGRFSKELQYDNFTGEPTWESKKKK